MKSIVIKYAVRIYAIGFAYEVLMEPGWTEAQLKSFCDLQFENPHVYKVHGFIVGDNEKRIIELV